MQQAESPTVASALQELVWKMMIRKHPDRRQEIEDFFSELKAMAKFIYSDVDAHAELMLMVRKREIRQSRVAR